MEIYAGMIDYMDESIGRILDYLRHSGLYDNTLIVFISDNGPSKTSIQDYLALGGASSEFFGNFDNSLGNRGLTGSSTDIGPGWAYAAATPLRLFKGYVAQGGIQVPAVIKLPGNMSNAGSRNNRLVSVMDLMPTFLAVADFNYPNVYRGVAVVPLQGKSLMPLLQGKSSGVTQPRELGWSAYGMDAYRQGDWKVLRLPAPYGSGDWQLYDLANDPGEIHDLRTEYPLRAQALSKAWEAYAEENGIIQPNVATAYAKPVTGRKF
jgi:arylsulfatase